MLMKAFKDLLNTALESKLKIALILGQVDDINDIRDRFGLISPEKTLIALELMLRERFGDNSSRRGDRFFVFLIGNDGVRGGEIAESIRSKVERMEFDERFRVSMHFGVSTASSNWTSTNGFTEMLKEAEVAIEDGRKRLVANRCYIK
jgi:GGDEF domain-containing protein